LKREDRKSRPFRVLVVCKGEHRRNNLAERLLQFHPPFSTMILIATLGECLRDPLGEVWMTATAFKEALGKACKFGDVMERSNDNNSNHRHEQAAIARVMLTSICE